MRTAMMKLTMATFFSLLQKIQSGDHSNCSRSKNKDEEKAKYIKHRVHP